MNRKNFSIIIFFIIVLIFGISIVVLTNNNKIEDVFKTINDFEKQVNKKYNFDIKKNIYNREITEKDLKYFIKANEVIKENKKNSTFLIKKGYINSYRKNKPYFFASADEIIYDNIKSPNYLFLSGNSLLIIENGKTIIEGEKILWNINSGDVNVIKNINISYNYNYEIKGDIGYINIRNKIFKLDGNIVLNTYDTLFFFDNYIIKDNFTPINISADFVNLDFKNKKYEINKNIKIKSDSLDIIADYIYIDKNTYNFNNVKFKEKFYLSNNLSFNGIRVSMKKCENSNKIELINANFIYKNDDFYFSTKGKYAKFELKFFNNDIILYDYNFINSKVVVSKGDKYLEFNADNGKYFNDFKKISLTLKNGYLKYYFKKINYISSGEKILINFNDESIQNRFVNSFNYYNNRVKEIYFESSKGKFYNKKYLRLKNNVRIKNYTLNFASTSDYYYENYINNTIIVNKFVNYYYFLNKLTDDWNFNYQGKSSYDVSIFAKCKKINYNINENRIEFYKVNKFENLKDGYNFLAKKVKWKLMENSFILKDIENFNSYFINNYLQDIKFSEAVLKNNGEILSNIKNLKYNYNSNFYYFLKINNGIFYLKDLDLAFKSFNFKLLNRNLFISGDNGEIKFKEGTILFKKIYNFRVDGKKIITDQIKIDIFRKSIQYNSNENDFSMDIE